MPKQYVLFGRPVPRLGTRHTSLLLVAISLFAVGSLWLTLPSAIPTGPSLSNPKFSMPKSLKPPPWMGHLNPFKQPAHAPPRQSNDTDGDAAWYSNLAHPNRWLKTPFSSSETLDENRSLLPLMAKRPPIYCYYDNTLERSPKDKDAESTLLLAWRKAWWAAGFEPIILSPAEGEANPLYDELQRHADIDKHLRIDLMRWMAWENMGGGMLAHYLLFPMGPYDDPLLNSLRRAEFPKLTRWKDLDDGLFTGPKPEIAAAIKLALASPHLKSVKGLVSAVNYDKAENPFAVDDPPASLAYYSPKVIETKYTKIRDAIRDERSEGLGALHQLINSHLHLTWQTQHPAGIAVVKPLPHHTTHLIAPAYNLATLLARCPDSPLPGSCPPNRPTCTPCNPEKTLPVTTPPHLSNTTGLYTIGVVPHPYTILLLTSPLVDIPTLRRDAPRDPWITALTTTLLPTGYSAAPRLLLFKSTLAAHELTPRSTLFLLAERDAPDDLDWTYLGFLLPPGGGSDLPPQHDASAGPLPSPEELDAEPAALSTARTVVDVGGRRRPGQKLPTAEQTAVREASEAWSLADAEAWRFARAYLARKGVERRRWEEREAKYADGMGSETGRRSPWDRWLE